MQWAMSYLSLKKKKPCQEGNSILILKMRKLRFRETKWLAYSHGEEVAEVEIVPQVCLWSHGKNLQINSFLHSVKYALLRDREIRSCNGLSSGLMSLSSLVAQSVCNLQNPMQNEIVVHLWSQPQPEVFKWKLAGLQIGMLEKGVDMSCATGPTELNLRFC